MFEPTPEQRMRKGISRRLRSRSGAPGKTLQQILGIVGVALIASVILHKGYTDISALAQKHSGERFWVALGQYFLGNLAGGGKPPGD
jgi:hypothetical protein